MDKNELIAKVKKLINLHKKGLLGGEIMPEDSNPNLTKASKENFIYFTLPMALNYQRNSYTLWQSALKTWKDKETIKVFDTINISKLSFEKVQEYLTKYKLALQKNKQTEIWIKLCLSINKHFYGDIRNLFNNNNNDIIEVKNYILKNKKDFPYLSGTKILNYWLYVISQYTNINLKNKHSISVAPDTHIIQSSLKLGVISPQDLDKSNIREIVSLRWEKLLKDTNIYPIDIHTPFWLWSRNKFKVEI